MNRLPPTILSKWIPALSFVTFGSAFDFFLGLAIVVLLLMGEHVSLPIAVAFLTPSLVMGLIAGSRRSSDLASDAARDGFSYQSMGRDRLVFFLLWGPFFAMGGVSLLWFFGRFLFADESFGAWARAPAILLFADFTFAFGTCYAVLRRQITRMEREGANRVWMAVAPWGPVFSVH